MQKISFYLLPNRIKVTTDVAGFNTEFRQVYQRKIKIYKGIDNTIEFEVRNSDSRKDNVTGYQVVAKFFDTERKNLFTITGDPIAGKPGLMSITVPSDTIDALDPQLLTLSAYITDGTNDRLLYADADFNLGVTVEVNDGYNEKLASNTVIEEITVFNYEYDKKEYVSEIAKFGTSINDDVGTVRTITVESVGLYTGDIIVEGTKDKSTAFGTQWTTVDVWNVTDNPTKDITGDWRYLRFTISQTRGTVGPGSGARFTVTKTDGVYTDVIATLRGQNYLIGDTLTILGSQLGGVDAVNDITVTVTGVTNGVSSQGNVDTFTWSGIGTAGTDVYQSIGTDPLVRPPNPVDKILIRN